MGVCLGSRTEKKTIWEVSKRNEGYLGRKELARCTDTRPDTSRYITIERSDAK